jgi:phage shock protein C
MNDRLYRIPADGKIAGVCAGLGERFQVQTKFIRAGFIIAAVCGLFVPVLILYAALTLLLPTAPGASFNSFGGARLRSRFDSLDGRLARIEAWVTSEDYRLRQQFRDLAR